MKNLKALIESHLDKRSDDDSYILAEEVKEILRKNGYHVVENFGEAEKHFGISPNSEHQISESTYQAFDIVDQNVSYNVKMDKYYVKPEPDNFVLSVLITEL